MTSSPSPGSTGSRSPGRSSSAVPAPEPTRIESGRLADQLERSFRGGAWHGPSVSEVLAGVGAEEAFHRALPGTHTIAEVTSHLGFWVEEARRRILGEASDGIADDWQVGDGSGSSSAQAWNGVLAALEQAHRRLHGLVGTLDDARLDQPAGSDPTVRGLLLGIVQHNAYHAGQIALLKKVAEGGAR